MRIAACSRAVVPKIKPLGPFLWITIANPDMEFAPVPDHFPYWMIDRLCLRFWDAEIANQIPGGFWTNDNQPPALPLPETGLFQPEQAAEILQFVDKWVSQGGVEAIIVNCEGGQSRSVAVAAALAHLAGDENLEWVIVNGKCPNQLVYRTILKASEGLR